MLEEIKWCNKIKKKHFKKMMNEISRTLINAIYVLKNIQMKTFMLETTVTLMENTEDQLIKTVNYRLNYKIPVIFHNFRGYDSHFIMQTIGEIAEKHKYRDKNGEEGQMEINMIPNKMEKYMAFMLGKHLVFINSLQFMNSSLDKLARNLPNNAFKYISEDIESEKKLNLLKQKGIYPYDYMDSFEKFNENKLSNKDDFSSILNDEHISSSHIYM